MMSKAGRGVFLAVLLATTTAIAQPQVSVTISGGLDEIIAVLVQLRNAGFGEGVDPGEDPMKVEVHSITTGATEEPVAPAPADSGVALGLHDATLPPAQAGQASLVSVRVTDTERVMDTVAVEIAIPGGLTKDLYDNGDHGDTVAADGVWMRTVAVPDDTPPGVYPAKISAYNANGEPIVVVGEDGEELPLTVAAELTVTE